MKVNKIHNKLEQLINSLTIKENHETFLRGITNSLYNELNFFRQYQPLYWPIFITYPSILNHQYGLERFWYGGSFDRGIFIKNRFDIDMYLVYSEIQSSYGGGFNIFPWNNYQYKQTTITGRMLFELLYSNLKASHSYCRGEMKILKDPPYGHAIPIRMDYQGISVIFDCIPAIEMNNGYLIIPNGMGSIKKVNPNLEEQALSKLNKMQDGKITKLILLTKYWNFNWGKSLKGYLIERLVESIFDEIIVHTWDRALKTFFSRAINILDKQKSLPDRVYTQYSVLDEYSDVELEKCLGILREAAYYAHEGEWNELFQEI